VVEIEQEDLTQKTGDGAESDIDDSGRAFVKIDSRRGRDERTITHELYHLKLMHEGLGMIDLHLPKQVQAQTDKDRSAHALNEWHGKNPLREYDRRD
jgi:hypothetical protein